MPFQLEVTLKPDLFDAEGAAIRRKAMDYFGIELASVRTVQILTIDADLNAAQLETLRREVFTNPVTQISSFRPLAVDFDWTIWVGLRPGVRDNAGSTAAEAIEDILGIRLEENEGVYTSRRYCLRSRNLDGRQVQRIAADLLANDIIQRWQVISAHHWQPQQGVGFNIPRVILDHAPTVETIAVDTDAGLCEISRQRGLALNPADIPTIRAYFLRPEVQQARTAVGLSEPTDVELEYISQARSDHCNHNTFRGRFAYLDLDSGREEIVDNLFETCIEAPTLALKAKKPWVMSVLWDNAGVGRFDDGHLYVITGETHNSPSNMEAYGGAITGIVGVYRDPMGTGKGARLVMGAYGFCVGPRDYAGNLSPRLHPRRLLDGIIEGVRDGGNKSGIPTTFGQVTFDTGYLGKSLVFVTAVGVMPAEIGGRPSYLKKTRPGQLIVMCGGRVGKDGIHGVTAASEVFSEHTPAGHVQIGDPYTQKKMHDFLLQARNQNLIHFITDNGGGGLSSSVGESARFANGCEVELDRVPLKYAGLDQWEIWVSESQERMTVAVAPEDLERFMDLSALHAVESTVIGRYTDSGKLHIRYAGKTCAYVDLDLPSAGFPQWEFEAHWRSPESRGLCEPVLSPPQDYVRLLKDLLARPNLCAKEWITRQYDHEVQGGSVLKPLVGRGRDVPGDAAVIRPILRSTRGLAFSQALLPAYSAIDAYHMTTCTVDEALRRLVAVGANPAHVGGVDNFCWPSIQYDAVDNPDGRFKAAQLVRSCRALKDMCRAYEIPLLSGKDSMYVDGYLKGPYGEHHRVSALETLQFSAISVVADVTRCVSLEAQFAGDRIYVLGSTRNELGASEYYAHLGHIGCRVPQVRADDGLSLYRALAAAIEQQLVASAHGIYRGGLGVHLAMIAMGGNLGLDIDLTKVPCQDLNRDDQLLFSESAGRFLVTVAPQNREAFERLLQGLCWGHVGQVTDAGRLRIQGLEGKRLIDASLEALREAWKKPFGGLR